MLLAPYERESVRTIRTEAIFGTISDVKLLRFLLILLVLVIGCSDNSDLEDRLIRLESESAALKEAPQVNPTSSALTPESTPIYSSRVGTYVYIANTDGDGVRPRAGCQSDAARAFSDKVPEGSKVWVVNDILSGKCVGWLEVFLNGQDTKRFFVNSMYISLINSIATAKKTTTPSTAEETTTPSPTSTAKETTTPSAISTAKETTTPSATSTAKETTTPSPTTTATQNPTATAQVFEPPSAIQQPRLAGIPGSVPDYDRGDWSHWSDEDRDCQNARAEVLIVESLDTVSFRGSKNCTVDRGRWFGVYSGKTVTEASQLDVDHMVPLKNAHLSGGWRWDAVQKKKYANDLDNPEHLVAVTASANRSKGASGPESWRPERTDYWCEYATDWIAIKNRWDLSVTSSEWNALLEMLETCGISSPSIIDPPTASPTSIPTETATPSPTIPSQQIGPRTGAPLLYDPLGPDRNCGDFPNWAHAQDFYEAAGGNNAHGLDRNRDGIACESLSGAP